MEHLRDLLIGVWIYIFVCECDFLSSKVGDIVFVNMLAIIVYDLLEESYCCFRRRQTTSHNGEIKESIVHVGTGSEGHPTACEFAIHDHDTHALHFVDVDNLAIILLNADVVCICVVLPKAAPS